MPVLSPSPIRKKAEVSDSVSRSESANMQTVGRMVSSVAHDFNNLLTGIVLCSDLILAGLEQESRLRRYASEIRSAGAQGAGLVQQLLAIARDRPIEPRILQFNEVIGETLDLLVRLVGEHIELLTELEPELETVMMDPTQARQVLLNLVLNARDAMPDGGRIALLTRNSSARESAIEFEVRDTGCGIDSATRAKIFEPFFTTKGPHKGNGLGLSTVQSIVQENGGRVRVESEPGKGTRVIVCLPVASSGNRPVTRERFGSPSEKHIEIHREKRGKRA